MRLSVLTVPLYGLSFEEAIIKLKKMGVESLEVGAGGYPGDTHLHTKVLLENENKVQEIKAMLKKHEIDIAALACHGNPVHPNKEIADQFHQQFKAAILLAEKLGVETIVGFSGCPGDCETSKKPNWVTCPWPEDFGEILEYQWNDVLIPYWKDMAAFAQAHGVKKIALEMHPGFCVYNPATLLRLREAVGDVIGANFDPSHLYWQGMNPVESIKVLKGAIYHFHAKDTKIDQHNTAVNGVLDNRHYGDVLNRSWVFRTVGYGHSQMEWNDMISTLHATGYQGVISIEHEDGLMSIDEGLKKAVDFLKKIIICECPDNMWWA